MNKSPAVPLAQGTPSLTAWNDDVALMGPDAPLWNGQIEHLIRYLLTVHKRFGNTAVAADIELQWGGSALHKRDEQKHRIAELEAENAALSAQVVEYQKELGIRQNMTPTTRFNNICKALEEQKNDSPYSAESWDTLVAEHDGLRAQVVELQKDAERYRWMRENWGYAHGNIFFDGFRLEPRDTLDDAIDAAMRDTGTASTLVQDE